MGKTLSLIKWAVTVALYSVADEEGQIGVTKAFSSFSCEATAGSNFAVDFHIKQKEKQNPKFVDISPI